MTKTDTFEENPDRVAYSYIRFSTPEQKKGTSFQRQSENSNAYAVRRGLRLDTSLNLFDEGRSAFTGENQEDGALAEFLEAIKTGKVKKGSVLIVENLDRLSRQEISKSISLFVGILTSGIEIVTLGEHEQVYTEASINKDIGQLIISLFSFSRGHEESVVKSERISAAWKLKRANPKKKLTAKAPAWLRLSADRQQFDVIEERRSIIQRIFEFSASGVGHHRIAKLLNAESVLPWGKSKIWNSSYIMKILSNRSVLGEFQPHLKPRNGKREPVGEPVAEYFPAIISPELFQKVHAGRGMRLNSGGRKGPCINNLFTHIAKCGYCGASMQFVKKSSHWIYLVCSAAKAGAGCKYMSWPYTHFEDFFLKFVEELDYSELTNKSEVTALTKMKDELAMVDAELASLSENQQRLLTLVEQGVQTSLGTIGERLRKYQLEEQQAILKRKTLELAYQEACFQNKELAEDTEELVKLVKAKSDPELRQKLATEIRRKVKRIEVCASGGLTRQGAKDLIQFSDSDFDRWLQGRERDESEWFFSVIFVNGTARTIMPRSSGYLVHGTSLPPSMKSELEQWEWPPE